jgi:hypothetical protein
LPGPDHEYSYLLLAPCSFLLFRIPWAFDSHWLHYCAQSADGTFFLCSYSLECNAGRCCRSFVLHYPLPFTPPPRSALELQSLIYTTRYLFTHFPSFAFMLYPSRLFSYHVLGGIIGHYGPGFPKSRALVIFFASCLCLFISCRRVMPGWSIEERVR